MMCSAPRWLPLFALSLALAACGQSTPPPSTDPAVTPEISTTASASGLTALPELPAGPVAITLKNTDSQPHALLVGRLRAGATRAQVEAALAAGDFAAVDKLVESAGGVNQVAPGSSARVVLDLKPGSYLLADATSENAPPAIRQSFTVRERRGAAPPEPAFDVKATAVDFGFTLPASVPSGEHVWQFVNAGAETHELDVLKLHDGVTLDQLKAFLNDPNADFSKAPADFVAQVPEVSQGYREFVKLSLTAGNYAAVCFVETDTHQPHFDLGMLTAFSVAP